MRSSSYHHVVSLNLVLIIRKLQATHSLAGLNTVVNIIIVAIVVVIVDTLQVRIARNKVARFVETTLQVCEYSALIFLCSYIT